MARTFWFVIAVLLLSGDHIDIDRLAGNRDRQRGECRLSCIDADRERLTH